MNSDVESSPASAASAAEMLRKRILIVDDHPLTRRGLAELIGQEPDLCVCGEAGDAGAALEAVKTLNPDLAVVDITLPGPSGLALTRDIRLWAPSVYVLLLSMHDEDLYAERALRAGGHGYIMKREGAEEVLKAIRQVLAGKTYVSQGVSGRIVDTYIGRQKDGVVTTLGQLTDREFEVFQLLGQGLPTSEIGRRLHLSAKTVDSHRSHIKEKLKLDNVPELLRYAVRWTASEEGGSTA